MPKPRIIDSGFFDDLDVAGLSRDERLLMVAIVSRCADDYGRLVAHPAYLRKQAFGYDEDLSIEDVAMMRAHILEHCKNVVIYTVNGQDYIYLSNFAKYQKIRYHVDSKLPPPPATVAENSREISEISHESSENVAPHFPSVELSSVGLGLGRVSVESASAPELAVDDADDDTVREIVRLWEDRLGLLNEVQREQIDERMKKYGGARLLAALTKMLGSNGHSINYLDAILENRNRRPRARASPGNVAPEDIDWQAERESIEAARKANAARD